MHLALQIDDIARVICEYATNVHDSSRHSLINLARVQKGLGAIALDVLWKDIPAGALLYLFPLKSVTFNSKGERIALLPLSPGDWSRFDHYAPRIQTLRRHEAGPHWTDLVINIEELLDALTIYEPKVHILPHLQEIQWWSPLSEISKLTIFIGPSLRVFSVGHDPFGRDDILPLERVMAMILSSLCEANPPLEEVFFHFVLDMVPPSPTIEGVALSLFQNFQYLTQVGIKPSVVLMHTLGMLPALTTLILWSVDNLSASGSVERQESETLFPTLDALMIHSGALESVTALLQKVPCFSRTGLWVYCTHFYTNEEVLAFLEVATDSAHSRDLREVVLAYDRDDDVAYDMLQNLRDHSQYRITLSHIRSLLTCRNLEKFHFGNGLSPLVVDDNDLRVLTSAWPNIISLDFGSPIHKSSRLQPRVTLQGLAHLAACTNLEYLSLYFVVPGPDEIDSLGLRGAWPSNSPLRVLDVQISYIGSKSTVAMACFLAEHFPVLHTIYSGNIISDHLRGRWQDVNVGLNSIRRMVDRLRIGWSAATVA